MLRNSRTFFGKAVAASSSAKPAGAAGIANFSKRSQMSTVSSANQLQVLTANKIIFMSTRLYSAPAANALAEVFSRIGAKINPDIVKSTKAVYQFDVKEGGSFFLDLKNGDGSAGASPNKADVTLTASEENFLKIFGGQLNPAAAFMTGKLKLKGEMAKATLLEMYYLFFTFQIS